MNIYKKQYKVTNTDVTPQWFHGTLVEVGESVVTDRPPEESYSFSVEPIEEKKKKKTKEE